MAKVHIYVCGLMSKVASGEISMQDGRKRMREWYSALPQKEKDLLAVSRQEDARVMTQVAEGLAQELTLVSLPQQQT